LGFDPNALSNEQKLKLTELYETRDGSTGATAGPAATAAAILGILGDAPRRLQLRAANEKWGEDRCRAEALTSLRASRATPHVNVGAGRTAAPDECLAAALMVRSGHAGIAAKAFGADVMEQSRGLHRASFAELCAAALRGDNRDVPNDRGSMIRAAVSTGSMPVALGNAAGKVLEAAYRAAPATWRSWCAVRLAADFKTQSSVRPSFIGDLLEVGDGGEVKHQSFEEAVITWSIGQFARKIAVGRKSFIDDNLGVFSEILPALGMAAQRSLASLVYTTLLANGGTFFASGNNNLMTGGTSVLSASSLATAVQKLRQQKDANGATLDLAPAVLLVPPELETTARALLSSVELARVSTGDMLPTGNPFAGLAALEVEGRLSNTAFTGSSTTAWYLLAAPADVPMIVGFLDGNESPTLETFGFDSDSDRLEMAWRCTFDFG